MSPLPTGFSCAIESPLQPDIRALIADLNATLLTLTPQEFCYHLTAEEMATPSTTVFVIRTAGQAVATGSLKRHAGGSGEVKRMYTRPAYQGRGLGRAVIDQIEILARIEGLQQLVLETGDAHPAAWAVYERAGFTRCGPVLDYPGNRYSVFYAKDLQPAFVASLGDALSPARQPDIEPNRARDPVATTDSAAAGSGRCPAPLRAVE